MACLWSDFQAKPSILDPILFIFDDMDQPTFWAGLGALGPGHGLARRSVRVLAPRETLIMSLALGR